MNLSFEQKVSIFEDAQYGMTRYTIKPGKTNFKYKGKVIVREMRERSSVAYVWGKDIQSFTNNYRIDRRGWIYVHGFSEEEIRELLQQVLARRDQLQDQRRSK